MQHSLNYPMENWLTARARVSPHHLFINAGGGSLTFAEAEAQAAHYARRLAGWVMPGQHVALYMHNHPEQISQLFALMRLGALVVPINTRWTSAEVAGVLQRSDTRLLIPVQGVDSAGVLAAMPHMQALSPDDAVPGAAGNAAPMPFDLASPFVIMHTSGTSGHPKGAVLTYGSFFYSAMSSAYRLGLLPDDRWLCVLPLYHVGGLSIIMRAVLYGITVDVLDKFDAEAVNHQLTHQPISLVSLVPTMLYRLLEVKKQPWNPKLRLILLGGAAPSAELVQRCLKENIPIATTYGLTEAASQVATATPEQVIRKPGSVGQPLMFTQIRIVNQQCEDLPKGDYGDVLVKGPTLMQGYYNAPAATHKAMQGAWLHTGDIGYLDDEGDLWLVQRRSDLIITGGENVYPAEVEAVLRQHPAVKEAVVIGMDDPEWGQRVVVALQLHEAMTLTEDEFFQFTRRHLAGYKQPRLLRIVPELPQTASGKINRAEVKALFS